MGSAPVTKASWTSAYINDLPDGSFLYIEGGGKKDEEGKTTPRSLRHFPVKDKDGKVDVAHVRDALGRIPQSNVPASAKDKATAEAHRMLENANKADDVVKALDARIEKAIGVSFDMIQCALAAALKEKYPPADGGDGCCTVNGPWLRDVFDDVAIYSNDGHLYRIKYSYNAGTATLQGEPEEVQVTYAPIVGSGAPQNPDELVNANTAANSTAYARSKRDVLAKNIDATMERLHSRR